MNALATISEAVYSVAPTFAAVLSDKSLNFEREAGFAMQVIGASEYLQKVALGNRQAVMNAITNVAAIGITLNPARKLAYLVPRKSAVCLDISYMGLMDIAIQSGCVAWGQARIVHENDTFVLNGIDKEPAHNYAPFAPNRGIVVGAYCVVKLPNGDFLTEAMSVDEINAVRDRSDAWKGYLAKGTKCPWVTDEGEMQKKTVVKRAYKYWPKNERLAQAIHYVNTEGGEGLEIVERVATDLAGVWIERAKAAINAEVLTETWQMGIAEMKAKNDRAAYAAFKTAVQAKAASLKAGAN